MAKRDKLVLAPHGAMAAVGDWRSSLGGKTERGARKRRVSERFSSHPRRDTQPVRVRRAVHGRGLRYRVDVRLIASTRRKADIVFTRAKVAVFIDGCFWHGCPEHCRPSGQNEDWWGAKIATNRRRDRHTDVLPRRGMTRSTSLVQTRSARFAWIRPAGVGRADPVGQVRNVLPRRHARQHLARRPGDSLMRHSEEDVVVHVRLRVPAPSLTHALQPCLSLMDELGAGGVEAEPLAPDAYLVKLILVEASGKEEPSADALRRVMMPLLTRLDLGEEYWRSPPSYCRPAIRSCWRPGWGMPSTTPTTSNPGHRRGGATSPRRVRTGGAGAAPGPDARHQGPPGGRRRGRRRHRCS